MAKKSSFFSGALLGGIIGAASYFLFGTPKGKVAQKKIKKESVKTYEKNKPTLLKVKKEADKLLAQAKKEITKIQKHK